MAALDKSDVMGDSGVVIRGGKEEVGQQFYGLKPGNSISSRIYTAHPLESTSGRDKRLLKGTGSKDREWTRSAGNELHTWFRIVRFGDRTASSIGGGGGHRAAKRTGVHYI